MWRIRLIDGAIIAFVASAHTVNLRADKALVIPDLEIAQVLAAGPPASEWRHRLIEAVR